VLDQFFSQQNRSRQIPEAVRRAVEAIGPAELCVSESQTAFRRHRAFAWAWMPSRYVTGRTALLVLTLLFRSRRVWQPLLGRTADLMWRAPHPSFATVALDIRQMRHYNRCSSRRRATHCVRLDTFSLP
jgi:hypothetical protein